MNPQNPPPLQTQPAELIMPPAQNPSAPLLQDSVAARRGRMLSMTSNLIALFGIIPSIIFLVGCAGGFGMVHLLFYFLGAITHGSALVLGFCACFHSRVVGGLFGIFGNGIILLVATLCLIASSCEHRY